VLISVRELGKAVYKYGITVGKCKAYAAQNSVNFTFLYKYSDSLEGEGREGKGKRKEWKGKERRILKNAHYIKSTENTVKSNDNM